MTGQQQVGLAEQRRRDSVIRGGEVFRTYQAQTTPTGQRPDLPVSTVMDLLTDLHHYCTDAGIDWDRAAAFATHNYDLEQEAAA